VVGPLAVNWLSGIGNPVINFSIMQTLARSAMNLRVRLS
jgi:hypothetical protein